MSGIIGISPDMNSGVVGGFPAGNVVQVVYDQLTGGLDHVTASAQQATNKSITYKTHNPIVYVQCQGLWGFTSATTGVTDMQMYVKLRNNTTSTDLNTVRSISVQSSSGSSKSEYTERSVCWYGVVTVAAGTTHEYGFYYWTTNGTYTRVSVNRFGTTGDNGDTFLSITEIAS
jgi:hypothetical protein